MGKIRHVIEGLISAFLFVFQRIPVSITSEVLPTITPMLTPLAVYMFSLKWVSPDFLGQMNLLFFEEKLMFGRIVAVTGLIVFLVACAQLLRANQKIVTTGLYSVVRHPQYFGIVVVTLGITIMSIQSDFGGSSNVTLVWLIQVLGYVLLAAYEERHLMNEHKEEYQQYKQKVSFIFPAPAVTKIPEPLFSLALALAVAFLLTLL
jgi:protein-S-isoprenylcysteine O-methyltransferase Ste14